MDANLGLKTLPPDMHGELVKHGDNGVIVNGVIAWIMVQKETNPPEIWKSIALKHYLEPEVKEAWKEMAKLKEKLKEIDPKMGLVTKGARQKTDLELDDIEEAINKLVEANCVPLVLASSKMMMRAPRFWGKDKGEDISGVAAELKELKEAMVGYMKQNEKQISELKEEVGNATAVIAKPKFIPRNLAQTQAPETPMTPGGTKRTRFDFENDVEVVGEVKDNPWINVTYAQKVGDKKKHAAKTLADMLSNAKNQKETANEKVKTKVIYGSATPDTEQVNLAADVSLVAFNVNKECSKDHMKTFLIEKGIDVIDVIEMTREEVLANVRVKSMKVIVKANEYEKAMDPSSWPCRVGVRLWKDKEAQKARYERWQEQSRSRSKEGAVPEKGQEKGHQVGGRYKGAGSQQEKGGNGVNDRHRAKSGNRYQGNIFEELLRQVLRA